MLDALLILNSQAWLASQDKTHEDMFSPIRALILFGYLNCGESVSLTLKGKSFISLDITALNSLHLSKFKLKQPHFESL